MEPEPTLETQKRELLAAALEAPEEEAVLEAMWELYGFFSLVPLRTIH